MFRARTIKEIAVADEPETEETGIQAVVRIAGGQQAVADLCGVTQQNVSWWLTRGFVPANRAIELEAQYGVDRKRLVDPRIVDLLS